MAGRAMKITPLEIVFVCILAVVIGISGYLFFVHKTEEIREHEQEELSLIADFKSGQIINWRNERIANALSIFHNLPLLRSVERYLEGNSPALSDAEVELFAWLSSFKETPQYKNILLLDANGSLKMALENKDKETGVCIQAALKEALQERKLAVSNLYRCGGSIYMDIIIPLFNPRLNNAEIIGAILLRIDPNAFLYPLIKSWPTAKTTAETLLVSREGDYVVFLNELKHRKNTALSLRFPLHQQELPAAMAVRGKVGVFNGIDYRGVPVLSAIRHIPGSPWFIIAKVDKKEIYASVKQLVFYFIIVTFLLVFALTALSGFVFQKRITALLEEKDAQLQHTLQIRSVFTSMVSHELRTPLTAIKEGIAIVQDETAGALNDEQKEFLDIAKRNVDRLARLINDVLDFQKLESGKTTFNMQESDINETVTEVRDTMLPLADERSLDLVLKLNTSLPKVIFDKDKITQVLSNLVHNAIKCTERGSITIATSTGDNFIKVSVADTGKGIEEQDIPRLFQQFEQIEPICEKKTPGTGLGLAISKEIIEAHKGRIWVESELDKGSTFNFILPVPVKGRRS